MTRSRRTGCVSAVAALGSYSSFSFHRNLNVPKSPGFVIDCTEMRGSFFTHPVRCASNDAVVHSEPPLPCARSTPASVATLTAVTAVTHPLGFHLLRLPSLRSHRSVLRHTPLLFLS